MDEQRKILAKKYEKVKLQVSIFESLASTALMIVFVLFGWSKATENFVHTYTSNQYLSLLIFFFIIGFVFQTLSFPLEYIFDFKMEHKYGLSNQTFSKWIIENLKSIGIGVVLVVPVILFFYWILIYN